jgi:Ni/Co efflux regulator RcnB
MKILMLAASAAVLLAAPGLSHAQDEHHDGGRAGGGQGRAPAQQPARPAAPAAPAPQAGGQPFRGGGQPQFQRGPEGGQGFHGQAGQGQPGGGFRPENLPGGQGGFRPQGFQNGQGGNFRPQNLPGGQGGVRPQGFQNGQPGRGGDLRPDGGFRGGVQGPRDQGSRDQGGFRGDGFRGGGERGFDHGGGRAFGYGGRQYFRYHAEPYRYPGGYYGWANHGWRRGEWLPQVFINSGYFIDDWSDFGLWQPDYGYEWIRVGYDAVLVNLADGQVADVVPGVYY